MPLLPKVQERWLNFIMRIRDAIFAIKRFFDRLGRMFGASRRMKINSVIPRGMSAHDVNKGATDEERQTIAMRSLRAFWLPVALTVDHVQIISSLNRTMEIVSDEPFGTNPLPALFLP